MAQKTTFDAADVDHFLKRTEFGITTNSRATALASGLPAYVDELLNFPTTGASTTETEAEAFLGNTSDPVGFEGKFPSTADITDWWIYMMMHSPTPFQERLALFFHDHFAISYSSLNTQERYMMVDYINKLRRSGTGNFKSLVLLMARDPAMLDWLDGTSNVKTEPNENFAREFFELFTVGADRGYNEEDIQEAARAFTGYRSRFDVATNLRNIEFDEDRKDLGAKVLFTDVILRSNVKSQDDFNLVVDATFVNLDVASWLSEKLILEFVSDTPTPTLIANLADVIRLQNFEMKPILRTLFLSEAFHARKKSMVRMPLEFGIGLVRSTGLLVAPDDLRSELSLHGQVPGNPPSVFGWPQGAEWLSAAGMVERANLARRIIAERSFQTSNNHSLSLPTGTPDADAVVSHLASLMGVDPSAAERVTLVAYLNSRVLSGGAVEVEAFDSTDARHINERARGLVYVLASHPDAISR